MIGKKEMAEKRVTPPVPMDKKMKSQVVAGLINDAAFACGNVIANFSGPALEYYEKVSVEDVVDSLRKSIKAVQDGDLAGMEAMLISQALALQAMFTTLASRAVAQRSRDNVASLMQLALKAQSQSRATIEALTNLKFPRSTIFAKQANIASGHQQVNNGTVADPTSRAHEDISPPQNKQLAHEVLNGRSDVDGGSTPTAGRSNKKLASVEIINGADKRQRKSHRVE